MKANPRDAGIERARRILATPDLQFWVPCGANPGYKIYIKCGSRCYQLEAQRAPTPWDRVCTASTAAYWRGLIDSSTVPYLLLDQSGMVAYLPQIAQYWHAAILAECLAGGSPCIP